MLVLVAPPLVAGLSHPCVEGDLRSRSNEPAGTHYLRGPTATYATADVRVLSLTRIHCLVPRDHPLPMPRRTHPHRAAGSGGEP